MTFLFPLGIKGLYSLWSTIPGKNYPSRGIALIQCSIDHINTQPKEKMYYFLCFFLYEVWCLTVFVKVTYALFICEDTLSNIMWCVEMVTFHQRNFSDMKIRYHLILIYIPTKFGGYSFLGSCTMNFIRIYTGMHWNAKVRECSLLESCNTTFLNYHVIKGHVTQWLHTISSFPPHLVYMSFLKLLTQ